MFSPARPAPYAGQPGPLFTHNMTVFRLKLAVTAAGMTALFALPAAAQTPPTPAPPSQLAAPPAPIKIEPCPAPEKQPPADSPALTRCIEVIAHPLNETIIDPST